MSEMDKTKVLHIVGALNLGTSIVPDFNLISTCLAIQVGFMKKKFYS